MDKIEKCCRCGCLEKFHNHYQCEKIQQLQAENEKLQAEHNQAIKFLEEALPHIECENHFQCGLITAIGTFLNALKGGE
ncbi:MAG: hypothetical protein ACYSSI_00305 [Planctomycetota bacterium]|jgi:hypothetical protein